MKLVISHTTAPGHHNIKEVCLKVNEFSKLNEAEQIAITRERGILLTELQDQQTKYQLYRVDDMYVEVISETKSGRNKSIQVKN